MNRRKEPKSKQRAAAADDRIPRRPETDDRIPPGQSSLRVSSGPAVAAVGGLLLLAVIAVFGQTAGHDFVNFDDGPYVVENRHVLQGLSRDGIAWAFTETHLQSHWHPLTWLSLMADAQALRPSRGPLNLARLAARMHLVNLALHTASALVLFLALRAMTASTWPSALVAAVFAVHPLHVESVAWIAERKDVLSGLFGMLALWAYAWYARRPSVPRYLAVAVALSLGLMAKPVLVTWPVVFLLLDYWPLGRVGEGEKGGKGERENPRFPLPPFLPYSPSLLRLVVEKIPLLLLVAASAAVAFLAQRSGGTVISLGSSPLAARMARAAMLYVTYLGKTVWPVNLAVMYPVAPMASAWLALGAGVLLALLTAGALWGARHNQRWLAVGWFWYLGTFVPTIGLIQVGLQVMADRFLYLPQIGICVAVVWGVGSLISHPLSRRLEQSDIPRLAYPLVSALLLVFLVACAWQQTSYWKNGARLWAHAVACTSNNVAAHYNLGLALAERGDVDEAIEHYREAVAIKPDFELAHNNFGIALAGRKAFDEAIVHYRKALEIKPDYAEAYYNLALALAGQGRVEEAIADYRKALEIQPDYVEAHNNLGRALAERGAYREAVGHFRRALEIKPDYIEAYISLGSALAGHGEINAAIDQYRKAVEIKPDDAEAQYNLGLALADHREFDEAMDHYRKAVEIKPDHELAHNNLGALLAARKRFDEAISHYRLALEAKPDFAGAQMNLGDALAGLRKPDEALAQYQTALGLAIAQGNGALADDLRARIRLRQPVAPAGHAP